MAPRLKQIFRSGIPALAAGLSVMMYGATANATGSEASAAQKSAPAAATGKQAWTRDRISPGLHSVDRAVTVSYEPAKRAVPAGALITRVTAHRDYAGHANVQTSLCWEGEVRCVDMVGRSVSTEIFNGLDAVRPLYLVHRVHHWGASRPPLYIKGTVTVWYAQP